MSEEGKKETQYLTPEIAGKVALYAMMAANAYRKLGRIRFGLSKLGWYLVDENGKHADHNGLPVTGPTVNHPVSGLAYDIYERLDTNDVVVAYRGTDSKKDYLAANLAIPPFNFQYRQARRELGDYLASNPQRDVTVTGHSLGGGLALSMSVHHGVPAYAFDPSPRIFDGLGDFHEPAPRLVVYQEGEILQEYREKWSKFSEVVKAADIYCSQLPFPPDVDAHRGDHLANVILKAALEKNAALKVVEVKLPQ